MPTPDEHEPHKKAGASPGYEVTDANVFRVGVFLVSMLVFSGVLFVVAFGIGKVINNGIIKEDGPLDKWHQIGVQPKGKLENMASDAKLEQEELRQMTERFPTPRLQVDNGDQDITDMHAREDLLLDHYSWIDQKAGKVRIPISRAMELIAKNGLPVAPAMQRQPLMAGDKAPALTLPLTNGFARTGFEEQELETVRQRRLRGEDTSGSLASLRTDR